MNEHLESTSARPLSPAHLLFLGALVLGLIALIPVAWFPLQLGKLAIFSTLLAVCAAWILVRDRGALRSSVYAWWIFLLPAAYGVSALFAADRSLALTGFNAEVDTILTTTLLAVTFVFAYALFRAPRAGRTLFTVLTGVLTATVLFQMVVLVAAPMLPEVFSDRTLNLIGKWNDLGLLTGLLGVLLLAKLEFGGVSMLWRVLGGVALLVSVFLLGLINFVLGWVLLGVGAAAVGLFALTSSSSGKRKYPVFAGALVVVAVLGVLFGTSINTQLTNWVPVSSLEVRPSFSSTLDIRSAAHEGAAANLLVGTGPNTFGQQWLLHKPSEVNQSPFWNLDFNVGYSTLMTALVSVGLLGLLAWLVPFILVVVAGLRGYVRSRTEGQSFVSADNYWRAALFLGALYLLVSLAFYVPSQMVVVFTLALAGAAAGAMRRTSAQQGRAPLYAVAAVVLLLAAVTVAVTIDRRALAESRVNRGTVALNAGNADEALMYAQRAVAVEETSNALRMGLEAYTLKLQQVANSEPTQEAQQQFATLLQQAVAVGRAAVEKHSGDYRPHRSLGNLYAFLSGLGVEGAYESANTSYAAAAERNPTSPEIPLQTARLEAQQGNPQAVDELIGRSLSLKSNYTDAILLMVQLAVANNDLGTALSAAEAAVESAPQAPALWFQLGLLQYAGGNTTNAIPAFEQAITLAPDYANARYFLGLSYYAQGRAEEAVALFEDLQRTNPDNTEVQLILSNMRFNRSPFEGATPPATTPPEERDSAPIEE